MSNHIIFTQSSLVSGPSIEFSIFNIPISTTVMTTWFIILLLFVLFKFLTRNLSLNPSKGQVLLESIYEFLDGTINQILGEWRKKYFTFFGTLFIYIFVSNITSFFPIPGFKFDGEILRIYPLFRSPTADLNTTISLAAITTFVFVGTNIKYNGLGGYLKSFAQPTPIMLPLNVVGEIAKPLNISMRLFGNMFAGMVIMGLLYVALPWVIPAPLHLYFDLFQGLVQSYVFLTLSMVYVQSALGDNEYVENK